MWGSSTLECEDIEGDADYLVIGNLDTDIEFCVLLQASSYGHCFPESLVGRVSPIRTVVVEGGTSEDVVHTGKGIRGCGGK